MARHLGANTSTDNLEAVSFSHTETAEPIFAISDPSHMVEIVRSTLADYDLLDKNNEKLEWKWFLQLVEKQEKVGLHLGTKIRRRHVQFQNEKINV